MNVDATEPNLNQTRFYFLFTIRQTTVLGILALVGLFFLASGGLRYVINTGINIAVDVVTGSEHASALLDSSFVAVALPGHRRACRTNG